MGNTCGCVDNAEKDGEVKVENNKLTQQNNHRQAQINNYRDSTVSKGQYGGTPVTNMDGLPQLFATDDQYLIDL
jgi:hypothetical protein